MPTRRFRKMGYGLLAAGLVGGAALGLGDPPAKENPFINRVKPVAAVDIDVNLSHTQNPSVALEWAGPGRLRVGEAGAYTLTVRNTCGQPLQKVSVQVRVPKDANVTATSPGCEIFGGKVITWDLPALEPKAVAHLNLSLASTARGEMGCQAWVTFTGTAGMTVAVREPQLACKVLAPEAVAVGDVLPVTYVVTNPGDTRLENVVLRCGTGDVSLPPLEPGQEVRKVVQERPTAGGVRVFPASVIGSDRTAADASASVRVQVPKLTASVSGPAERVVGRKAVYTLTVTNSGEVPLDGIQAAVALPDGLRLTDKDGTPTGHPGMTTEVGKLAPGQTYMVPFEAVATAPGGGSVVCTASGSRNTAAKAECRTAVTGIPAIRMEVVDLADPVEVNGLTTYEVRITNTGSQSAAAVALVCELPDELRYAGCDGPTAGRELERVGVDFQKNGDGKTRTTTTVTFDPITELAPKTEAVYRVKVRTAAAGDVRFKATLTSRSLSAPVAKEESTRVFGE